MEPSKEMGNPFRPVPPASRVTFGLDRVDAQSFRLDRTREVQWIGCDDYPSLTLTQILEMRRSERQFGGMEWPRLRSLLCRLIAPRMAVLAEDGYVEEYLPVPSAGARHPHTLLIRTNHVEGIEDGPWVVDRSTQQLVPVVLSRDTASQLTLAVASALRLEVEPPATLVLLARQRRTLSKYPTGMNHVWRDAGALLAIAHLIATDLGLASCIVGTGEVVSIPLFETDESLVDTGALSIGTQVQGSYK